MEGLHLGYKFCVLWLSGAAFFIFHFFNMFKDFSHLFLAVILKALHVAVKNAKVLIWTPIIKVPKLRTVPEAKFTLFVSYYAFSDLSFCFAFAFAQIPVRLTTSSQSERNMLM